MSPVPRPISTSYDRKDDTGLVYRWMIRDRQYDRAAKLGRPISREMALAAMAWRRQETYEQGWSDAVQKALYAFAVRHGLPVG